jgi:CheY-like chemotaxis protein
MRILIIDDEKIVADTLTLILQRAGHQVRSAYDSASAYALLTGSPASPSAWNRAQDVAEDPSRSFVPDCAICDVILPGVNGIEVSSMIASINPACHIFLCSGLTETCEIFDEARARGLSWELLAKPVAPDELLEKLAALSAKRSSSPSLPSRALAPSPAD